MLRNVSSLFNIFADWSVASKFRNINIHEEIRPPPLKCTCTCLLREHNVGFQCIASYSTCTLHALMYRRVCYACTVVHYIHVKACACDIKRQQFTRKQGSFPRCFDYISHFHSSGAFSYSTMFLLDFSATIRTQEGE